jgi:hypothetical protein
MAIHLPLYPSTMGSNPVYLKLMDDWTLDSVERWSEYDLRRRYTRGMIEHLIDEQIVKRDRNESLRLMFRIPGTPPSLILTFLSEEMRTFQELQQMFPRVSRCSPNKLKNLLIYLHNFHQIQYLTLPATTLTLIALEGPEWSEQQINDIYESDSRGIEPRFFYHEDLTDDTAKEFRDLSKEQSP